MIYAQNKGDIIKGPIFGVNYTTVSGNGIDSLNQYIQDEVDLYQNIDGVSSSGGIYSSKAGYNLGFFVDYYFIDNIAFCTGLSYSEKGYDSHYSSEITTGLNYQIIEEQKVNLNYIDFPLVLQYHLNNGIDISGGLLLSFLVSDKVVTESTETFETIDTISGNIISSTEISSEREDYNDIISNRGANPLLTGFQIDISYTIKRFIFSIKLNKSSSFGRIVDKGNNKNTTFQFCTGISF